MLIVLKTGSARNVIFHRNVLFSIHCIHNLKKPSFVTTGESVRYVLECDDYRKKFVAGDTLKFQLLLLGKTVVYFNLFL